jgi:hypothetical protein
MLNHNSHTSVDDLRLEVGDKVEVELRSVEPTGASLIFNFTEWRIATDV